MPKRPPIEESKVIALYKQLKSANAVANVTGSRKAVQSIVRRAIAEGKVKKYGKSDPRKNPPLVTHNEEPPPKAEPVFEADDEVEDDLWITKGFGNHTHRYFFTSAQNNTRLHVEFWDNLIALAQYYCADIFVTPFTYNKVRGGGSVIRDTLSHEDFEEQNWRPELIPYLCRDRLRITEDLVFMGDANIRPTILNPIPRRRLAACGSGSGIFPSAQRRMDSLPRHPSPDVPPRYAITTGACTMRNYRKEASGDIADEHHVVGALLVEVDVATGDWWARHVKWSKKTRSICDLDIEVKDGKITTGNQVESIVFGDLHEDEACADTMYATFGPLVGNSNSLMNDNAMDLLRPKVGVVHDALDFNRRSHHDRWNIEAKFVSHQKGKVNVEEEINSLAKFLEELSVSMQSFGGEVYVVASNHNDALTKWLSITDGSTGAPMMDEENLLFYLKANERRFRDLMGQVMKGVEEPFHDALRAQCEEVANMEGVTFMKRWDSLKIHGVEHAYHGDMGTNGSRGSTSQFTQMDAKVTKGHSHSPGIQEGVFTVGTMSTLKPRYARNNPTSWDNGHCVLYKNQERALLLMGHKTKRLYAERGIRK